jgi:hypothetical protein
MNATKAPPPGVETPPSPGVERDRRGDTPASAYPRRRSRVRARAIEEETVILDCQRNLVHQLNETASYVWDRCDGEHSVAAIASDLVQAFDVALDTATKDVAHVVRQLDEVGLVDISPASHRGG